MAGLRNNNEDQYKQIIRKFQRVLEANGISMSLRQIKTFDTIELAGTAKNGQERVLINDVRRKYGNEAFTGSEAANVTMPFIPEGVLKARTTDRIYYTYFRAEDEGKESNTFSLTAADHQLCDGLFRLMCIWIVTDIPKVLDDSGSNQEPRIAAYSFPDFMEKITDTDLLREMSGEEARILRQISAERRAETRDAINNEAQKTFGYMITTFRAINFLNEQKRKAALTELSSAHDAEPENRSEEERKLADKGDAEKESRKDEAPSANFFRTVKMGDWYTYRSTYRQPTAQGKSFTRHAEQWLVTGHMRHYKTGKTVYIQPYYKGPGREQERKGKVVIKVEEDRKK